MKLHAIFLLSCISLNGFSASVQHMQMIDPLGVTREIYYENKQGYAIAEGDIILGKINKLTHATIIPYIGGDRWPDGEIPFVFTNDLPQETIKLVNAAMKKWEDKTNVKFIEVPPEKLSQYPDYIAIQPNSGTTCASEVGRKRGKQLLKIASRCTTMSIAHELGHALGLWHEQSRQDRDQYIQIIWENIAPGHESNFNQHLKGAMGYGPYDYDSIMHYSSYAFSIDKEHDKKTIIPLEEGVVVGQRTHLSSGDITAVRSMYG